ncbi:MAG TPA: urease accessory UreF family protein [Steroidobacteraceae bacterium]|nr:urease accessory UreF family protein [Steroidobacteraceae bacterium]
MNGLARVRLLQMASQAFPIGGYSHSYGLEAAVESGLVSGEASLEQWVADVLSYSIGRYELPLLHRMSGAWRAQDSTALGGLNEHFLATRESAEIRGATVQTGFSMRSLIAVLPALPEFLHDTLRRLDEPCLPCVWSGAAAAWEIPACDSAAAYAWSWAENQVLVGMKTVPIGQSAGQRVLLNLGAHIAELTEHEPSIEAGLSNFAPGLAIQCARHETQYSRLFRS